MAEVNMKQWIRIAMLAAIFLGVFASVASAINHKVTITNQTGLQCSVWLTWGSELFGGLKSENRDLGTSGTVTFETGAKCPRWIHGGCSGALSFSRCTNGLEGSEGCTATCWSSDWFLKKKSNGQIGLTRE